MVETLWEFIQSVYVWFFGSTLANDPFISLFTNIFSVLFLFGLLYTMLFYPCVIMLKAFIDYFKAGRSIYEINR